ncbi:MAG: EAL domain-containing protein [Chloroflexi bacterium]|nr:EAL domain-containing protein [Chloroflexota bacterium]
MALTIERLSSSWLLRCLDVVLVVLIVTGIVVDPLALSHGIALVLVIQAFLLDWRAASLRVVLTAVLTTAGAFTHSAPLRDIAIQVPFVYGLAALVVLLSDSLRRSRGAAERLALYDTLTDLPNRVLFRDRVEQALRLAVRDGRSIALLLMDLDRFKEVNDTFGHHAGDLLLSQVGPQLRDELRAGDTLARLGGDEFALLLPGASAAVASAVAERVLRALARPFIVDGQPLTVGASIGIACSPEHASDAETLLRRADVAMYVAKRGRGSWVMYALDQEEGGADRLALMAELASAVDSDQLSLYYQPQIDAGSGRIVALEALMRWEHPVHGLVPPDQFIPIAERSGTIHRLTERALLDAIRHARAWRDAGFDIQVSVNISTRDLLEDHMPDGVRRMLEAEGLPPERLILEITESGLMADQERAVRTVTRLRELGVGVSIDDFGTGYSSIAYLRRLSPTEVKIDRSFVAALDVDPDAEGIVRATVDIGHVLGLTVVAEGVEDAATRTRLARLGADRLQGYAVARPMPAGEVDAYLRREAVPALAM